MGDNRIIQALVRRVDTSKTFGENIIFMLNRASELKGSFLFRFTLTLSIR